MILEDVIGAMERLLGARIDGENEINENNGWMMNDDLNNVHNLAQPGTTLNFARCPLPTS